MSSLESIAQVHGHQHWILILQCRLDVLCGEFTLQGGADVAVEVNGIANFLSEMVDVGGNLALR